jgi:hypothetical protein
MFQYSNNETSETGNIRIIPYAEHSSDMDNFFHCCKSNHLAHASYIPLRVRRIQLLPLNDVPINSAAHQSFAKIRVW